MPRNLIPCPDPSSGHTNHYSDSAAYQLCQSTAKRSRAKTANQSLKPSLPGGSAAVDQLVTAPGKEWSEEYEKWHGSTTETLNGLQDGVVIDLWSTPGGFVKQDGSWYEWDRIQRARCETEIPAELVAHGIASSESFGTFRGTDDVRTTPSRKGGARVRALIQEMRVSELGENLNVENGRTELYHYDPGTNTYGFRAVSSFSIGGTSVDPNDVVRMKIEGASFAFFDTVSADRVSENRRRFDLRQQYAEIGLQNMELADEMTDGLRMETDYNVLGEPIQSRIFGTVRHTMKYRTDEYHAGDRFEEIVDLRRPIGLARPKD